jgi:hypothetical protein
MAAKTGLGIVAAHDVEELLLARGAAERAGIRRHAR